jgi:hypothetical protein
MSGNSSNIKAIDFNIVTNIEYATSSDFRQGNFSLIDKDDGHLAVVRSCNFYTTDKSYFRNYKTEKDYKCFTYLVFLDKDFKVNRSKVLTVFSSLLTEKFFIEDVRLFRRTIDDTTQIWGSASVRPISTSTFVMALFSLEEVFLGRQVNEIYLLEGPSLSNKIHHFSGEQKLEECTYPFQSSGVWEKGWMPMIDNLDNKVRFIYKIRPFVIAEVDITSLTISYPITKARNIISDPIMRGSSQVWSLKGEDNDNQIQGYVCIIHETKWINNITRIYFHRLVTLSADFEKITIGPLFRVMNPMVEFVNGLYLSKERPDDVILCLGVNDETSYCVRTKIKTLMETS